MARADIITLLSLGLLLILSKRAQGQALGLSLTHSRPRSAGQIATKTFAWK